MKNRVYSISKRFKQSLLEYLSINYFTIMSHHKAFFEKYATPISIMVAGLLVGAGIFLSKTSSNTSISQQESNETSINLKKVLKGTGINQKKLEACIANQDTKTKVDNDMNLAQGAGMQGTPHMVILTEKEGKPVQVAVPGAQSKVVIEYVIDNGELPEAFADYAVEVVEQTVTDQDRVQGNTSTAKATIIEYSDIDCPFCKRLHPTLDSLVNEGKIVWVYRHSPIPQLHPDAYNKAITAECIAEVGGIDAFWKYLDATVS